MAWSKVSLYQNKRRRLPWEVRWYGGISPETGKLTRYSRSFRTKREAEDFQSDKGQEFRQGGKRDRPENMPLGRLCDDFLATLKADARIATITVYLQTILRLEEYFGETRSITTISPRDADAFVAAQVLSKAKVKAGQERKKLSDWSRLQVVNHCKTIFGKAVTWELILSNPFSAVRKPKPVVKKWHRMTVGEYKRLLDATLDLRLKCLYAILYTSAPRSGEAFSLTWADIDFVEGKVHILNREGTSTMPPFLIKGQRGPVHTAAQAYT